MDGQPYMATRFATSLRRQLYKGVSYAHFSLCFAFLKFLQNILDSYPLKTLMQMTTIRRPSCVPHRILIPTSLIRMKIKWLRTPSRRRRWIFGPILPVRIGRYSQKYSGPFPVTWSAIGMPMMCGRIYFSPKWWMLNWTLSNSITYPKSKLDMLFLKFRSTVSKTDFRKSKVHW